MYSGKILPANFIRLLLYKKLLKKSIPKFSILKQFAYHKLSFRFFSVYAKKKKAAQACSLTKTISLSI